MDIVQHRLDYIPQRHSVRNFQGDVSSEIIDKLRGELCDLPRGPFGGEVRMTILSTDQENLGQRLGTYGVIKGAKQFLVAAVRGKSRALCDLGFVMEHAILDAVALGLGTCWIGGTFRHGAFAQAIELQDDEQMATISPLGIENSEPRFIDRFMKWSAKSAQRKSLEEIYTVDSGCQDDERYKTPLEMVRIAPSALNSQPWRIRKTTRGFLFSLQPGLMEGKKMAQVDLGIAMAHFAIAAHDLGLKGSFKILDASNQKPEPYALWNVED